MANLMAAEWDFSLPQDSGRQALLSRCCVPPAVPAAATEPGDSHSPHPCPGHWFAVSDNLQRQGITSCAGF